MTKINKNSIITSMIFALGILAIIAFAMVATVMVFKPMQASAYFYGGSYYSDAYTDGYGGGTSGVFNNSAYPPYVSPQTNTYPAPVQTSKPATSTTSTTKKTATKTSTNKSSNTSTNNGEVESASSTNLNSEISSLGANALAGSNGFLPSGLIQWLFVAIFILLAVIAYRSVSGKDKYNSAPMKHA